MNIRAIRSDKVYAKMIASSVEKKNDIYRYELMQPFEGKWACYHVPIKASKENGYDVIMANNMLDYLAPDEVDKSQEEGVKLLSENAFWKACQASIEDALGRFVNAGIILEAVEDFWKQTAQGRNSKKAQDTGISHAKP